MTLREKWNEYRLDNVSNLSGDPEIEVQAQEAFYAGAETIGQHLKEEFRGDAVLEIGTILAEIDDFRSKRL
jgi:hypothetical protein